MSILTMRLPSKEGNLKTENQSGKLTKDIDVYRAKSDLQKLLKKMNEIFKVLDINTSSHNIQKLYWIMQIL